MLLDTIILVLRETLEAGALISLMVSVSNQYQIGLRWLWLSLIFGTVCAIIYALNYSTVTGWFDYVGQEVLNASMQFFICFCLLAICAWLIYRAPKRTHWINGIMLAAVTLAIVREGSEIIIFYSGFMQVQGSLVNALTSGFVGLTIGISFGVLCYFLVSSWRAAINKRIQIMGLTLIAAGLTVQANQLLMQIDWIESSKPVWDSGRLLSEQSITGQMIYALFGYEATPSLLEVSVYLITVALVLTMLIAKHAKNSIRSFG